MTAYTLVHVAISLVGIGSGFVVVYGLLTAKRLDGWTALFLASTVATSATGFGFPFEHLLPSHVVGAISIVVLAAAIYARYVRPAAPASRWLYAATAVLALYLNVFVLIVQMFLKVPALKQVAPTQSEAPFVITQATVLALFFVLGVLSVIRSATPLAATNRLGV